MNVLADNRKRNVFITIISVILIFAVIVGACAVYLGDYYRADHEAIGAFLPQGTAWKEEPDGTIVFEAEGANKGFIFYPGGKVQYTAYAPLMRALAEQGVLCVLAEMPLNLAVLNMNAAEGIPERYPQVERWYIGGHSLGGSMAASYAAKAGGSYEGLVLLGAYSTADVRSSGMDVISVYGSEDRVMNAEKYAENIRHLPDGFEEHIISGGCHAGFGCYGPQEGDGTPSISSEAQIAETVQLLMDFFN